MISKNEIRRIQGLHRKKERKESCLFLVEGVKNVNELLASSFDVEAVFATMEGAPSLPSNRQFTVISEKEMQAISALSTPSPALAVARMPPSKALDYKVLAFEKSLFLDGIQDPGNMGTIIRSADWFGVRNVFLSPGCVDPFNPKVVQATMGSLFRVQMSHSDFEPHFAALRSANPAFGVFAAALGGDGLRPLSAAKPGALIIGSEANGIEPSLLRQATAVVTIPGVEGAESLNAAVAAGVLLYRWTIPQS